MYYQLETILIAAFSTDISFAIAKAGSGYGGMGDIWMELVDAGHAVIKDFKNNEFDPES